MQRGPVSPLLVCLLVFWPVNARPASLNGSVDSATGILPRDLEKQGRSFARELEKELRSWDSADEADQAMLRCLADGSFDPSGVWHLGRRHDSTFLAIERASQEQYRVELWTRGPLGEWRMTRQASRRGAVLILDGPVKEYRRVDPFTRIYQIRASGRSYLVPSAYQECLVQALGNDPCAAVPDHEAVAGCVFERKWDGRP